MEMQPEFRADLHCHSTCSDGSLSPEELIQLAKKIGLSGLSITDHDTVSAYPSILSLSKELGLKMISGVEFSTIQNNVSVHVLGYSFDMENKELHHFCERHQQRRHSRNQAILDRLAAHGMPLTEEEVTAIVLDDSPRRQRTIGRPHIAQAMVKKGYVKTVLEAFRHHLSEDKNCYVRGSFFSIEETIAVIQQAGGFAIIAHPHLIKNYSITNQLLTMNFDGMECYYGTFFLSEQKKWLKIAKKKNWLITGGSDFHGAVKPMIPLGCSFVDEEAFQLLHTRFLMNNS